jgi:Raf kinase inhibitor-like YbhB/YbcL family protein
MRNLILASSIAFALSAAGPAFAQQAQTPRPPAMTLTIPGFPDGGTIPVEFTQAAKGAAPGGGTSPEMSWENAPEGTESFVLHVHDLDVARNNTTEDQLHWLVWNIPATANGLPQGVPEGSSMADGSYQTSASGPVYRGPGAPASGPLHHYVFELYALDTMLDVKPSDDAFENRRFVLEAIQGHIIGKASYVGLFKRPE